MRRNFSIDPTGNYLFAANQDSSNIVAYKIDQQAGTLSPTGDKYDVGFPVCVVFLSTARAASAH